MFKLNKFLLVVLATLFLFACISTIVADDSGSGSIDGDDDSPVENYSYGGQSNTGSADSEDIPLEDPLDEEYYDSDVGHAAGESDSINLSKHATG